MNHFVASGRTSWLQNWSLFGLCLVFQSKHKSGWSQGISMNFLLDCCRFFEGLGLLLKWHMRLCKMWKVCFYPFDMVIIIFASCSFHFLLRLDENALAPLAALPALRVLNVSRKWKLKIPFLARLTVSFSLPEHCWKESYPRPFTSGFGSLLTFHCTFGILRKSHLIAGGFSARSKAPPALASQGHAFPSLEEFSGSIVA